MGEAMMEEKITHLHQVESTASDFVVFAETLTYDTNHPLEFIDITEDVKSFVRRSKVNFGQVSITSDHTTAAVIVNENEPLLLNDMARVLARFAPTGDYYEHNDFSIRTVNMTSAESANAHSHCQQLLLGGSESLPVHNGSMRLGRWQSIFFVELDHARPRSLYLQAIGMKKSDVDQG
jgi:secondary thiamine-phosphate synthase enzyme|tara:strand:- start:3573 stop:4106 length:534 start_codon:yes stop_codon:yes gene_type:complete